MIGNEQITVKCNKCNTEYCFFPQRVIALRECECGNDDWGSPRDWDKDNFGNFTFIKRENIVFSFETPFGKVII
jgi:hypothetical protein